MDFLLEWLPRVGAALTILIGAAGFLRPTAITDGCEIELKSAKGFSEARAVFGGLLIGWGTMALVLNDPNVFLALGVAWVWATADKSSSFCPKHTPTSFCR